MLRSELDAAKPFREADPHRTTGLCRTLAKRCAHPVAPTDLGSVASCCGDLRVQAGPDIHPGIGRERSGEEDRRDGVGASGVGKVCRARRGRCDGVEDGDAELAVVAMVDVTTPEDQRLGIRAEHDVGLDCSHDRHEAMPSLRWSRWLT